mmetsp:Transcript_4517/g.9228  ORF Transcript_4517/g.9228 Transcript_4517/m.9228 type:complete len:271 (+) Transcript_4517:596-1408(+)
MWFRVGAGMSSRRLWRSVFRMVRPVGMALLEPRRRPFWRRGGDPWKGSMSSIPEEISPPPMRSSFGFLLRNLRKETRRGPNRYWNMKLLESTSSMREEGTPRKNQYASSSILPRSRPQEELPPGSDRRWPWHIPRESIPVTRATPTSTEISTSSACRPTSTTLSVRRKVTRIRRRRWSRDLHPRSCSRFFHLDSVFNSIPRFNDTSSLDCRLRKLSRTSFRERWKGNPSNRSTFRLGRGDVVRSSGRRIWIRRLFCGSWHRVPFARLWLM